MRAIKLLGEIQELLVEYKRVGTPITVLLDAQEYEIDGVEYNDDTDKINIIVK